ncbi:hypothetical protein R6Z07F_018449 [Ovis aries]
MHVLDQGGENGAQSTEAFQRLSEGHFEPRPTPKLRSAAPADLRERGGDATVIRVTATDGTRVVGELQRPQGEKGSEDRLARGPRGAECPPPPRPSPAPAPPPPSNARPAPPPRPSPEPQSAARSLEPAQRVRVSPRAEGCRQRSPPQTPGTPAQPALPAVAAMEPLFLASPLTVWNTSSAVPSGSGDENGTLAGPGPSPGARAVVVPVLYLLVCAVGLGGNALVIYVVLRHAKMKTVTNIYILNLAVADVLLMLGLPFVATQNAISYWPFGPVLCRLVMTLDGINQFTSIFCLTVMSVDRYLAVVHPIRSARWRRPRVAKLASAAVWAFSLVMSLPLVVFADIQEGWNTCNLSWPEPVGLWGAVFIIYTSVLGFFGPLLVICLCYVLIVVKLKASGVRVGSTRRRSERKVTRMVVVVVLVFAGCWLPFFIVNIVNLAFALPEEPASAGAYFFVVVLSYANSCANPLLYGFLSDNFRQSFRKVLCLRKGYGAGAEDADATEPRPGPSSRLQEATMPMRSCKANGLMQTSKL